MKFEPLDFELNPQLLTEGFTQSELTAWDNCPELWYLRYNLLLTKKGTFNWPTVVGSAIHAALEEWYSTRGKRWSWELKFKRPAVVNQQWLRDCEYWDHVGRTLVQHYVAHYKHDFELFKIDKDGIEHVIDFEYEGFRLMGKMDLKGLHIGQRKRFIMDHKSTGKMDKSVMMGWRFRFQFMFYLWSASKMFPDVPIEMFIPNAIKKPQLKYGEKDSIHAFCSRLGEHIREDTTKYFYREPLILKRDDLKRFEEHILKPKLFRLRTLLNPKVDKQIKLAMVRNKNTEFCVKYGAKYACHFLDLCQNGFAANQDFYEQRQVKHTELADDEGED